MSLEVFGLSRLPVQEVDPATLDTYRPTLPHSIRHNMAAPGLGDLVIHGYDAPDPGSHQLLPQRASDTVSRLPGLSEFTFEEVVLELSEANKPLPDPSMDSTGGIPGLGRLVTETVDWNQLIHYSRLIAQTKRNIELQLMNTPQAALPGVGGEDQSIELTGDQQTIEAFFNIVDDNGN